MQLAYPWPHMDTCIIDFPSSIGLFFFFWIILWVFWSFLLFSLSLLSYYSNWVFNMLLNMSGPCVCSAGVWAALFLCSYITMWPGGGSYWEPESPWAGNAAQTFPACVQTHWWVSICPILSLCLYVSLFPITFHSVDLLYVECHVHLYALFSLQLFYSVYDGIYDKLLHSPPHRVSSVTCYDCGLVK